MRLIVTTDDDNGMMFNGRRQSQDAFLRRYLLAMVNKEDAVLWMNGYSGKHFQEEDGSRIRVDEDFLAKAGADDYCLLEDMRLLQDPRDIRQIVWIRWNRRYPADVYFDTALTEGMQLVRQNEFAGSSHEKITAEVYEP